MSKKPSLFDAVEARSTSFAVSFVLLFAVTFGFLSILGLTPDASNAPAQDATTTQPTTTLQTTNAAQQPTVNPGEPLRIVATSIGLDAKVVNPTSSDVNVLDDALTQGAVRYPTSALLGQNGTVLIFGHSSYLPIVYHQYYKTFDGIQNLKQGDIVSVYSGTTVYRYSVVGVRVADANDQNNNVIELPNDAPHLTLVTCDSFATKSNRFVVTADFVGSAPLQ